jgi:hypothetical protein
MTVPGTAMLIALISGVVVAQRAIRERALTGPVEEVRGRHQRREAALAEAAGPPGTA